MGKKLLGVTGREVACSDEVLPSARSLKEPDCPEPSSNKG